MSESKETGNGGKGAVADAGGFSPGNLLMRFSNRLSLTRRILAVNIFAIVLLMGGLLFLDNYRERLFDQYRVDAERSAQMLASLHDQLSEADFAKVVAEEAVRNAERVRLYDADGLIFYDSFIEGRPAYRLRDASDENFIKNVARFLDRVVDFLLFKAQPPAYNEPNSDILADWPIAQKLAPGSAASSLYYSGDFTPVILGAAENSDGDFAVLVTRNPREVRKFVRAERFNIFLFSLIVIIIAVALSRFLARTLVDPLLQLTRAAIKVRWGRERQISVPRMPERRDEIGLLSRAIADMAESLRDRIDATEAFAADVAHEVKNPLASLRSALESIRQIDDADTRQKLLDIADDDVRRMDRMITDISEVSRVDSELSRARFERVDLGEMLEQIVAGREARMNGAMADKKIRFAFARPRKGSAVVMGEDMRLARVFDNLIDNAIGFSPAGGLIEVIATEVGDKVLVRVRDEGPGVAAQDREAIFNRFHSHRPDEAHDDGQYHSGLGLAICRTIIEAHQGRIAVHDREDGKSGAVFDVRLPAAKAEESL